MTDAIFDQELQEVLGESRCTDATEPEEIPCGPGNAAPKSKKCSCTATVDAPWIPHKPTAMDKLKDAVKTVIPLSIASCVIFWWQMAGYMMEEAATPALWVLAILLGISLGRAFK